MSTFDISTCFSQGGTTLDAQVCAEAVAPLMPETSTSAYNGGSLFALRTDEVFFGTRRAHTNVRITVRDTTYANALELRAALVQATGVRWNTPTQDFDDMVKELDGKSTLGMFTTEGAVSLHAILDQLEADLRTNALPAQKLEATLEQRYKFLAAAGHDEVTDTSVREAIWSRLDRVLEELGIHLANR